MTRTDAQNADRIIQRELFTRKIKGYDRREIYSHRENIYCLSGAVERLNWFDDMQDNALFFLCLRWIFAGLFIITLVVGVWLLKYQQKLFGVDPNVPSESSGARLYSKVLITVIWLHALLITGGFFMMFR